MKRVALLPVAVAAFAGFVVGTALQSGRAQDAVAAQAAHESAAPPAHSAREIRGRTPYLPVQNEPPPRLIVDEPLPDRLNIGVALIQYRTENCRILPVFGK